MQEQQIAQWAKPPSEAEEGRSLNALAEAVAPLRQKFGASIQIIRQGSHYNRTNIRLDSDVDVAIVHTGYYFSDTQQMGPVAKAIFDRNFSPSTYTFATYKDDVEQALRAKFAGRARRGNKCILVAETQNRNACDVVPAYVTRPNHRKSATS